MNSSSILKILGNKLKEMKILSQIGERKNAFEIVKTYALAIEFQQVLEGKIGCIEQKTLDCFLDCNYQNEKILKEFKERMGVGFDIIDKDLFVYPIDKEAKINICKENSKKETRGETYLC